jgi:lysophospholipase L1-like esterase
MEDGMRRRLVAAAAAGLLAVVAAGASAPPATAVACGPAWVAAWTAAPRVAGLAVSDTTIRHVVRLSTGGSAVRLRLSNLFGRSPLRIDALTVGGGVDTNLDTGALLAGVGSAQAPQVVAGTRRTVRFGGSGSVTVAPGAERWSDPVVLPIPAFGGNLIVSLHLPGRSPALTTLASGAQVTTGWQAPGDHTTDDAGSSFTGPPGAWSVVRAVDVLAPGPVGLLVAFGDSLTEGYGSTPNAAHRYPDILGARLLYGRGMTVVNAGMSGNRVARTLPFKNSANGGPVAVDRFTRDALSQSGVTDILLLEGVNDVIVSTPTADVIKAYRSLIASAHARGIRVIGGTLPPSGDLVAGDPFGTGSVATERGRAVLNAWIRTPGHFDGIVDFDAAVRDPISPAHWRAGLSVDGLHPNDYGYRVMADTVDVSLFRGPRC